MKYLTFLNCIHVLIKYFLLQNGVFLDSCILLGSNSIYSASENENAFLEEGTRGLPQVSLEDSETVPSSNAEVNKPTEFIIELQVLYVVSA